MPLAIQRPGTPAHGARVERRADRVGRTTLEVPTSHELRPVLDVGGQVARGTPEAVGHRRLVEHRLGVALVADAVDVHLARVLVAPAVVHLSHEDPRGIRRVLDPVAARRTERVRITTIGRRDDLEAAVGGEDQILDVQVRDRSTAAAGDVGRARVDLQVDTAGRAAGAPDPVPLAAAQRRDQIALVRVVTALANAWVEDAEVRIVGVEVDVLLDVGHEHRGDERVGGRAVLALGGERVRAHEPPGVGER